MRGVDQATLKSFIKFLTEGNNGLNCFRVAHFQRPYVWPERMCWQLLEDLWDLYKGGKPSKPIGCVITHATAGNTHEIVDGQQRLITLHIVFRAVVYFCRRHGAGDLMPTMQSLFACNKPHPAFKCKDSRTKMWAPRFMLFDYDEMTWFHEVFLSSIEDTDRRLDALLQNDDVLQQRLPFVNNFKTVLSFLADRCGSSDIRGALSSAGNPLLLGEEEFKNRVRGGQPGDFGFYMGKQFLKDVKGLCELEPLDAFLQYTLEKVVIIHFVTYDPTMAVDIFNALNRPGLPLAAPQRLKASLLVNIDYSTVDGASSVWNEAERKMMGLMGWEKEPLTPFLRCLLEMTPKPPSPMAEDFFYANPSCPGKFRQSHRLDLLDEFQEFCVDRRDKIPPAPPNERLRLYEKNGTPNNDAVAYFIETYLCGSLVPMYISLVNLGDQNSWGEGPYLTEFSEDVRMKVQNSLSCLKHLYHLDLDRDWVYPALLASHLWGLHKPEEVEAECVEAFFDRLETFASYLVFCRPLAATTQRARDKVSPLKYADRSVWVWPDKATREERMLFYRELMEFIYSKSPREVVEWLELTAFEKIRFRVVMNAENDQLFSKEKKKESDGTKIQEVVHAKVDPALQQKVLTYMLLKVEVALSNSPQELMESFDHIAAGLRCQSFVESSVEEYRQFDLRPVVPATAGHSLQGWTKAELLYVRDNLRFGNLTLTLLSRKEHPAFFDDHTFEKFLADVAEFPSVHGFLSTTRLLTNLPQSFTRIAEKNRHKTMMKLAQQSWSLMEGQQQQVLNQELGWFRTNKVASGLKGKFFPYIEREDDRNGDEMDEKGDTDLDLIIKDHVPLGVGVRVQLHGLQNAAQLNGKFGKVVTIDDKTGRYMVEVDGESRKSLKAENLKPMVAAPPTYPPPAKAQSVRIQPAPKRQAHSSDPKAKVWLCRYGQKCNNWHCKDAHNHGEWRCYQYIMGQCVPECTGFIKSCPSRPSERKRKQQNVEFEPRQKILPSKRPRLEAAETAASDMPKATFQANGHCPWARGSIATSIAASMNGSEQVPQVMQAQPKYAAVPKWAAASSSPIIQQVPKASGGSTVVSNGVWQPPADPSPSAEAPILVGTVTEVLPFRKFGWITPDANNKYFGRIFFHFSQLVPQWSLIRIHDRVSFSMGYDPQNRRCAVKVVRLADHSWWW